MKSKVKNIIKNYPCTVFLTLLILLGIIDLLVVSKVYAGAKNTSGCYEEKRRCTDKGAEGIPYTSNPVIYCRGALGDCICPWSEVLICPQISVTVCAGVKDHDGCGTGTDPCAPSDCDTPNLASNCGKCYRITTDGCEYYSNTCQKCIIAQIKILPYYPGNKY